MPVVEMTLDVGDCAVPLAELAITIQEFFDGALSILGVFEPARSSAFDFDDDPARCDATELGAQYDGEGRQGWAAIQFDHGGSITLHALVDEERVYLNVFRFELDAAERQELANFTVEFFKGSPASCRRHERI